MKKLSFNIAICALIALPLLFSACSKNTDKNCKTTRKYTYYEPVFKTVAEARANIKSNPAKDIERPGKIYIIGSTIFLNEIDKGIHVIDNRNPAAPKRVAFIDIPGNMDIAVKGNILYADMYTDLVAIDISKPLEAKVTKFVDNLFPYRHYANGFAAANQNSVITDWVPRKITITDDCNRQPVFDMLNNAGPAFFAASASNPSASVSPVGVGGSMARFTIINDRLYTVSTSDLGVYNISDAANPQQGNRINVGWNIETIYPFKNRLFIGSQSGMFIYALANADAPVKVGEFSHVRSCDPVIADDNYAYVTLRSGSICQGFTNELDIVKLNDFINPSLLKKYEMTNPHGLSKDGAVLFICDGAAGLKVYNAANVTNLTLIKTIPNIDAYDVIAYKKVALVVAKDGLYQYDYTVPSNLKFLSKMLVKTR